MRNYLTVPRGEIISRKVNLCVSFKSAIEGSLTNEVILTNVRYTLLYECMCVLDSARMVSDVNIKYHSLSSRVKGLEYGQGQISGKKKKDVERFSN